MRTHPPSRAGALVAARPVYPLVWGFKESPILSEEGRPDLHPALLAR